MSEIINVTRSSIPEFEEYCNEIRSIWDSHWLTNMGEKHQRLEAELKEYLGVPNVALLTNGHLALENIIEAMELKGEIITTPFTFASTTHAIVRCGCTPVFCDIDPADYTIDVGKLDSLITDKTVAIMPVHVYGNLCNVEEIDRIAKKHGLKVIYDAAHAFGVTKNGISSACFGDAAMFSFHATKVFNTIEGGALCFKDAALAQRIHDLKNFGIQGPEDVEYVGGSARRWGCATCVISTAGSPNASLPTSAIGSALTVCPASGSTRRRRASARTMPISPSCSTAISMTVTRSLTA